MPSLCSRMACPAQCDNVDSTLETVSWKSLQTRTPVSAVHLDDNVVVCRGKSCSRVVPSVYVREDCGSLEGTLLLACVKAAQATLLGQGIFESYKAHAPPTWGLVAVIG